MKKEKLVSIIIPVYNVENYITRCIDSILNQTFKDYEIILVDDESTDSSLKIIKEYEKKYNFIKVFSQKNSGPALARNKGLENSNAKYIMFIDSDDYIDSSYIEEYIKYVKEGFDVVIGGYKKINNDKIIFKRKLKDGEFSKYVVTGPYCHLYSRKFLVDNNILFKDTLMSEDICFNLDVFSYNPKIKIIDSISYNYYTNLNSISNTSHKGFNEKIDFLSFVTELLNKKSQNIELHEYFIIRYVIWYLLYSGKNVSPEKFYNYYIKYFKWLSKNISNFNKNKYIKIFGPKGEQTKIGIIIFAFIKLSKLNLIKIFAKIYCRGN